MTILAVDFMNLCHRARSGFTLGNYSVVFNFFRQFKSLVDQFKPTKIYVALEGRPVHRYEALDEYKANRKVDPDDPKAKELEKFFTQVNQIVNLLSNYFPVSVVRHPTSECDDTLANLVKNSNPKEDWIIISSDTDFIQLLQEHDNLRLYNPVQKRFIEAPEYPYITWKALRGDSSDNIPGIPGIGDKTADKLASDYELLKDFISKPDVEPIFTRNYNLIQFKTWNEDEEKLMTTSSPKKDWGFVKDVFLNYGFNSITKDEAWSKFVNSFETFWSVT